MHVVARVLAFGTGLIAGAGAGAAAGFFGTYYACVAIDWFRGAEGGNAVLTVGWVFCFFTVPAGLWYGGYLGLCLATVLIEKRDRKAVPKPPEARRAD